MNTNIGSGVADRFKALTGVNWSRRQVLRTLAGAAAFPVLASAARPMRKVGIIGGGMAGVSAAWLLDRKRDVMLLESEPALGGNNRSASVLRFESRNGRSAPPHDCSVLDCSSLDRRSRDTGD